MVLTELQKAIEKMVYHCLEEGIAPNDIKVELSMLKTHAANGKLVTVDVSEISMVGRGDNEHVCVFTPSADFRDLKEKSRNKTETRMA